MRWEKHEILLCIDKSLGRNIVRCYAVVLSICYAKMISICIDDINCGYEYMQKYHSVITNVQKRIILHITASFEESQGWIKRHGGFSQVNQRYIV